MADPAVTLTTNYGFKKNEIYGNRQVWGEVLNYNFDQIDTQIATLATAVAGSGVSTRVPLTRLVNTTSPLTGGGALSSDLTLALATSSITSAYLATDSVTAAQIAPGAIVADLGFTPANAATVASLASLSVPMMGATALAAGTQGYILAPSAGDEAKFFRGDGLWATVDFANATIDASQLTGTIAAARIPNLDASKITTGTISSSVLALTASDIPALDASKITSGTIASSLLALTASDIPTLDASKIGTGTIASARLSLTASDIPSLDAAKINSGTIASARLSLASSDIPSLDASKITTGTLSAALLPAFTGNVTSSAGSSVLSIANNAVTNSNLATVAASTIKGAIAAGNVQDLTPGQVRTMLSLGTAALVDTGTGVGNVPVLDASGQLATSVLPPIAISLPFAVADQAARLALTAQDGDIAIQADVSKTYVLKTGGDPTVNADWYEILTPTAPVTSVNSRIGAISLDATDLLSGTLADLRMPALTGDVTTSVGTVATTIAANAVTNAKMAAMSASTLKGALVAGNPVDLTASQVKTLLALSAGDITGLGSSATVDTTNAGNITSGTLAAARLPNIDASIITSGTLSSARLSLVAADIPALPATKLTTGTLLAAVMPAFTGDIAVSAGSTAATISTNAVGNSKLAQMAATTIKGAIVAGDPVDLTPAQALGVLGLSALSTYTVA